MKEIEEQRVDPASLCILAEYYWWAPSVFQRSVHYFPIFSGHLFIKGWTVCMHGEGPLPLVDSHTPHRGSSKLQEGVLANISLAPLETHIFIAFWSASLHLTCNIDFWVCLITSEHGESGILIFWSLERNGEVYRLSFVCTRDSGARKRPLNKKKESFLWECQIRKGIWEGSKNPDHDIRRGGRDCVQCIHLGPHSSLARLDLLASSCR